MSPVVILYEADGDCEGCGERVYQDIVACAPVRSVEPFLGEQPPGGWIGGAIVILCVSERMLKKCVGSVCVLRGGGVVFAYRG